jgi:hypothetical protein
MIDFMPKPSAAFSTIASYAGTTPFRTVGKATFR